MKRSGFARKLPERYQSDPDRVRSTPSASPAFRLPEPVAAPVAAIEKENRIYSEPYRRIVAELPCIRCGLEGSSQAAHPPPTGKGIKEDDRMCFPLCCTRPGVLGCHASFDRYMLMPGEDMRAQAEKWARETRAMIREIGYWPSTLPEWAKGEF